MPRGLGDDPLSRARRGSAGGKGPAEAPRPLESYGPEEAVAEVPAAASGVSHNDVFFQRRAEETVGSSQGQVEVAAVPETAPLPSEEAAAPVVAAQSEPIAVESSAESQPPVQVQPEHSVQGEAPKPAGFFKRLFGHFK